MRARKALKVDRNAAAGTLTRLADPAADDPCRAEGARLVGLLVEAQRRLRAGEAKEAERALQAALELAPDHADAQNLMSAALGQQGRAAEGEAFSRRALATRPGDSGFLLNLANRIAEQGRAADALAVYRQALRQAPRHPGIVRPLARLLAQNEHWDEARAVARSALDCVPQEPEMLVECAKVLALARVPEESPPLFQKALEQEPLRTDWWLDLARVAFKLERLEVCQDALEHVIEQVLDHAEARTMLASVLFKKRDYARMEEVLSGLTASGMHAANAVNLTGLMLVAQARIEEGLEALRHTEEIAPDSHELQMTRVMYLNYHPTLGREELFAAHKAFGERFARHVPALAGAFPHQRDPERRLRIGYISPDFRAHSVAYFVAPIFQAFDRARFDVVAYAHVPRPDHVSAQLQSLVSDWRDVVHLDDRELAERVRKDRIDILVDLAGYTASSRLLALTGRPAPVQISYLGYPNSTGLPQVDYRITDAIADPDNADDLYTESLIRLPRCFLCYAIPQYAPAIEPPPVTRNGHITFGSFNSLNKVNRRVIALWSAVLQAVPDARFLMKSLATDDPRAQENLKSAFAACGIDAGRIRFAPYAAQRSDHLAVYSEIDIALDTFPYAGTTTTCEALWMGVPVITLVGDRHAARVGASLLHTIGFTAGITSSEEDYVTTARLLAEHPELLAAARRHLRADLCRSPLCDMHGHARALEEAYRAVWRLWCEQAD